jgi:hypothetical protein
MPHPVILSDAAAEGGTVPAVRALFHGRRPTSRRMRRSLTTGDSTNCNRLTRMLSENDKRLSDAVALDVIALMDALEIGQPH